MGILPSQLSLQSRLELVKVGKVDLRLQRCKTTSGGSGWCLQHHEKTWDVKVRCLRAAEDAAGDFRLLGMGIWTSNIQN